MSFIELASSRFSVRSFKDTPVPEDVTEKILEAGRLAPTARNNQPQRIIAVRSDEGLEKFRKCTSCHFNAPLAFIVCCDTEECWKRPFDGKSSSDVDASIVATHMMLEAADLGIGSTWVMFFDPDKTRAEFSIPEKIEPVAVLVMGYAADDCVPSDRHSSRKSIGETVRFE